MLSLRRIWQRGLFLSAATLSLGILLTGCGIFSPDESKDDEKPVVEAYQLADTPDKLIENFVRAYNEKNYEEYEALLDGQFIFEFASADVDLSGTPNGQWDRQQDSDSTWKMFKSKPGKADPDTGVRQAPIQTINLILTKEGPDWTAEVPLGFEGTLFRRYAVSMDISFSDGNAGRVTGLQEFYVQGVEEQTDAGPVTVFKLKWWRDTGTSEKGGV